LNRDGTGHEQAAQARTIFPTRTVEIDVHRTHILWGRRERDVDAVIPPGCGNATALRPQLTSADASGTIGRSGSAGPPDGEEIAMDETAATPKTDAEYEAEFHAMLAEMRQMDEKSRGAWEEIERLKAE
jgi:hypothetical protein